MQRIPGHEALLGANRGCAAAFGAVYDCPVPVIAAVHGFCLGGGVGLAGNADIVIAAEDATFGLPEVDRGALGAATHLARLVPQPLMRAMVYTCRTVTARQLLAFGTVLDVVPPGGTARRGAGAGGGDRGQGPGRDPAGQAVAERHRPGRRQAVLPVRAGVHLRAEPGRRRGQGPAGVRRDSDGRSSRRDAGRDRRGAAGRDDDRDRRVGIAAQADGPGPGDPALAAEGPHGGVLRRSRRRAAGRVRAGQAGGHRVRVAGLDPPGAELPAGPPGRHGRADRAGRGHAALGPARRRAPAAVPADPGRARLRRARGQPGAAHGPLPVRRTTKNWWPCPRCGWTPRWCT